MNNIQSKFLVIVATLLLSSCDGGAPKQYTYTLANTPLTDIKKGEEYIYKPEFSPPITGKIEFTISNKPEWIDFDSSTGAISGIPTEADVRAYSNIEIQATIGDKKLTTAPFSITVENVNLPPTISGIPKTVAFYATRTYIFKPDASDPEGETLEFFIEFTDLNTAPDWISFDKNRGEISAQPEINHIGDEYEITISVSDGTNQTYLQPFTFSIIPGIETATISWNPPTENEDGTALEDLAGYNIYYGTKEGDYNESIQLNTTDHTTYTIENLLLPEYFFAMTAFDIYGNESKFSNSVRKKID